MGSRRVQIALTWSLATALSLALVSASPARITGIAATAPVRIAYATSTPEEVWTVNADGSDRVALAAGGQPLIAPDGTMVAIVPPESTYTNSGPALALDSTIGAMPIEIGEAPAEQMRPEAFSPDSRYLAVGVESNNSEGVPVIAESGLGVLDTESGTFTMIAHGLISGASFNPSGGDELVYGSSSSAGLHARSNLYMWAPGYTSPRQITTDGRSLRPVWGPHYIAYAHARPRRGTDPELQIWLRTTSGVVRQLTHVPLNPLEEGLAPIAFSQDGATLVANLEGEDLSEPWEIDLSSRRARQVRVGHDTIVSAAGISASGSTLLLIASLGVGSPTTVLTEPASGGRPKVMATHADTASWDE